MLVITHKFNQIVLIKQGIATETLNKIVHNKMVHYKTVKLFDVTVTQNFLSLYHFIYAFC